MQINNNQLQDILKTIPELFVTQNLLISIQDNGETLENKTLKVKQNPKPCPHGTYLPPGSRGREPPIRQDRLKT